jgi:hypothetical protein
MGLYFPEVVIILKNEKYGFRVRTAITYSVFSVTVIFLLIVAQCV